LVEGSRGICIAKARANALFIYWDNTHNVYYVK